MERLREVQKAQKADSRTQSLTSSLLLLEDATYDNVDPLKLYEAVLKLLILDYRNEARFRTPIPPKSTDPLPSLSLLLSNSHYSRSSSLSRLLDIALLSPLDAVLPSHLLILLEKYLNLVAMKKKQTSLDDLTRRSLLRFYTEILDPGFKAEARKNNKPEYFVMKFVASANKELVKMGTSPNQVPSLAFEHTGVFVLILISIVSKEKNSLAIIKKLNDCKESMKPKAASINGSSGTVNGSSPSSSPSSSSSPSTPSSINSPSAEYKQPSFRVSDMESAMISLLGDLFEVDSIKIQQDVIRLKDLALDQALEKDISQVHFFLGKDLGQFSETHFLDLKFYLSWKEREQGFLNLLSSKYKPLKKNGTLPSIPEGQDFYILPQTQLTRPFFTVLLNKCLKYELKKESFTDDRLFSKHVIDLITLCSKFWRIDYPTRATSLYAAAHMSGYLKDWSSDSKDLGPINLSRTQSLFYFCKRVIEELGKLDWEEKESWSLKDQEVWGKNLAQTYNELFFLIKDNLSIIFSKEVKPKFGPYLQFLGEYMESDSLFFKVEEMGLPKKWEKKLSKTLLRTSELRYANLLGSLPRNDTLNILHLLDISDSIVDDIELLQKRYKNPLLGFLKVKETAATVITGMFASDSKNIFKHIQIYTKQKNLRLPYGDALEVYKSLSEIRSIYQQVASVKSPPFQFDLEKFFYPYLLDWAKDTEDRFQRVIDESISRDNFEPVDLNDDSKKFSSSVLDIFTLVKEYLKILKLLGWTDGHQISTVYTILLKSISDGVLRYSSKITDKIFNDLNEEELNKLAVMPETSEKRKSGNWFDEVKSVVSNIQNYKLESEEPYNFKPETCIALNNLAAMMNQLSKLEELIDPEAISDTIKRFDPQASKKYTSHIFSVRVVSAENIKSSSSMGSGVRPYITMIDTEAKRTIAKTRVINNTDFPEWDEEFELTIGANSQKTISLTVWDERFGTHSVCGRAIMQLQPRNFKHDGLPQDIYLDLDSQGRVYIEVAVESERVDAIFVMGRAHRALKRSLQRCVKLITQKFSRFINLCFSRNNLKSICGNLGNLKPTQEQVDDAMIPLYDYLNDNLKVLAEFLSNELLFNVMLAAWEVVISSADNLLLPKLASAKSIIGTSSFSNTLSPANSNSASGRWQSAVTSAMANVGSSIGISGSDRHLTHLEVETVFAWLNYLCIDFFHNGGNGPPILLLKNEHYQKLLLLPVYYDHDIDYLKHEVERLSPAFIQSLRDKNNFENLNRKVSKGVGREGTIIRNKTISANATVKARAQAEKEREEARSDPVSAQTDTEDVILRILILKDERTYVARRLEQREKLAHSIATERLARAAAEGVFKRK